MNYKVLCANKCQKHFKVRALIVLSSDWVYDHVLISFYSSILGQKRKCWGKEQLAEVLPTYTAKSSSCITRLA